MDTDDELQDEPAMLTMLAEKAMHQAVKLENIAYCPTMDLIALATIDEQVHVHRLNGQRVFGVLNKKSGCSISRLQWKPNGQTLAVALSDSTVSLVSSQTGKAVHQIHYQDQSTTNICSLGWGLNFTDAKGTRVRLDTLPLNVNLDDVFNNGTQIRDAEVPLDLPTDLAFLDIEGALPKLSALPARDRDDEVFSSRASMDMVFHSSNKEFDDSVDVLLVSHEDGTTHLSIYDFFKIGTFETQQISEELHNCRPILHSSHPLCSTHGLLALSSSLRKEEELHFVPLDLRLIPETGRYLSLLASKSTQLLNIIRYIGEAQVQVCNDFKSSQDLPQKFIRNIEEDLQEKCQCDFVTATYHLCLTGNCYPPMKEWLVEELGERGHKRWEKAVNTGYENVRRLVHENLLPAMQRFSVLVSRLRGLSRFQESITNMGLVTIEIDHILDTVNCLQLLGCFIIMTTDCELHQFLTFSAWLKHEIEAQGTSLFTASDEALELLGMLDHTLILDYIEGAMLNSLLIEMLGIQSDKDVRPPWDPVDENILIYELYKKDIKACSQGVLPEKRLPGLRLLIARLEKQCRIVFNGIAEAQRRKVRFGQPILLRSATADCCDMRTISEGGIAYRDQCIVYIATVDKSHNHVWLHRIVLKIFNGISSKEVVEEALVSLPAGRVRDLKFVDDEMLMLAFSRDSSSSHLVYIPYRQKPQAPPGPTYASNKILDQSTEISHSARKIAGLDLSLNDNIEPYIKHTFPGGPSWTPAKIEVNGRKGRRAVCVVAEDRVHYRIFDIDTPKDIEKPEEEQADGSDIAVEGL